MMHTLPRWHRHILREGSGQGQRVWRWDRPRKYHMDYLSSRLTQAYHGIEKVAYLGEVVGPMYVSAFALVQCDPEDIQVRQMRILSLGSTLTSRCNVPSGLYNVCPSSDQSIGFCCWGIRACMNGSNEWRISWG